MLFLIVFIAAVIWITWSRQKSRKDPYFEVLPSYVFSFVALFGVFMLGMFVVLSTSRYEISRTNTPLASLSDSSHADGHWFLGTGYVDDERVINYVYGDNHQGFRTTYANSDQSVIYQDTSPQNAHVAVIGCAGFNGWVAPFPYLCNREKYEFHVPPGSIINEFRVDSEN